MNFTITTNNVPRDLVYGYELTPKEREEFDYYDTEELESHEFVRYRGWIYDPSEFMAVPRNTCAPDGIESLQQWDGYQSDSYFSGIVIRYVDGFERVIVGTYCS